MTQAAQGREDGPPGLAGHRRGAASPVLRATVTTFVVLYWWIFAYANSMVVYYSNSIFPLLSATNTPNPFFFLRTWSLLAFYNSGVQWALTGHIVFMFLLGNVFFSILICYLTGRNLIYFAESFFHHRPDERFSVLRIGISFVMFMMLLMPLLSIPLFFLPTDQFTYPIQVLVTNYAPVLDMLDVLVLLSLLTFWRKLVDASDRNARGNSYARQ